MRSWQSGAAISPTIRTGSSPPPSSTGGQLSSKTLPVEVFTRRWYHTMRRVAQAGEDLRFLRHARADILDAASHVGDFDPQRSSFLRYRADQERLTAQHGVHRLADPF